MRNAAWTRSTVWRRRDDRRHFHPGRPGDLRGGRQGPHYEDLTITVIDPLGDSVAVDPYEGELVYETLDLTQGRASATINADQTGPYDEHRHRTRLPRLRLDTRADHIRSGSAPRKPRAVVLMTATIERRHDRCPQRWRAWAAAHPVAA
jgi:hypothetical protein